MAEQDRPLPKFDAPPVIETVLGAQFARLPGYATAMAGWFWKSKLPPSEPPWAKVTEAPYLPDQFERFGEDELWAPLMFQLRPGEPQRTQIIRADDERMVQIQDSRFILNWRKQTGGYPSFGKLQPEFWRTYHAFEVFVQEAGLGTVEPNQWEVTYVNHIPKGELWTLPSDWERVVPGLYVPSVEPAGSKAETLGGDWRFALPQQRGRLYVSIKHGKSHPSGGEFMVLQFTARGPVEKGTRPALDQGLKLGHEAIVRSFAGITSPEAHKHWKRTA